MADLLDAINFLEIQNTKSGTRAESRLRDLEGRAQYLTKKTGHQPVNWYEFSREVPPEKPSYATNATVGAGVGAVILGGFAVALTGGAAAAVVVPALLSGAIFGGLVGGYHKTENTSRAKQVDAYEQYLNQFESAQGHAAGPQPSVAPAHASLNAELSRLATAEGKFTEMLTNETKKEKDCGCKNR